MDEVWDRICAATVALSPPKSRLRTAVGFCLTVLPTADEGGVPSGAPMEKRVLKAIRGGSDSLPLRQLEGGAPGGRLSFGGEGVTAGSLPQRMGFDSTSRRLCETGIREGLDENGAGRSRLHVTGLTHARFPGGCGAKRMLCRPGPTRGPASVRTNRRGIFPSGGAIGTWSRRVDRTTSPIPTCDFTYIG